MNGILDWKAFDYKFSGNPLAAFETLAYHMFCRKYHITEGLPAFYNQKQIETDPYHCEDGTIVGFQTKYYSTSSITTSQKSELIKAIERAKATYDGLNMLCFYLSRPFSQSSAKGEIKTEMQKEIESKAGELGITIEWIVPSNFEKILNEPENADLREFFFSVEPSGETPRVLPKCLTTYLPLGPEIGLVGRDEIVDELRAMLDAEKCVALVRGLGGIGKTAVMQKVCDKILNDGDDRNHVAWITCGGSLEEDLLVLSDAFGIPNSIGKEESLYAVLRAMKGIEGRLYLFLDDLSRDSANKDLETLNALRPNVHVMITSRHKIDMVKTIELTELDQNSALEMFYRYYGRDEKRNYVEDVRKIVEIANRNTLLVELLAKAATQSSATLDVFRGELEKKGFFEVSKVKLDGAHDEKLTIEESITRLYGISGLTPEQRRIMSLFSIFTPEKVIYGKAVEWAGFDENDVEDLVQLGWLVRTEGGYVIHQIVRDSLARQVGDSLKIEEYGELLEKAVDTDSYLAVKLGYTKVRERLVLAEDVASSENNRIEKMLKDGKWSKTDEMFLLAISVLFSNMAGVYEDQGEYEKALKYYRKALEIRDHVFGTEHPKTAATYNDLAGVHCAQGEYEKALEYCNKALGVVERALGSAHPDTATIYNNMAGVYYAQGNYEKALEYYRKALEIRERILGINHPDTATTYNNMALVLLANGDYEEALKYIGKALEVREREFGSAHPDTAASYNDIARVYCAQGEYEKALEYYREAQVIRERILGTEHPETATTYNDMAGVYEELGEYEKALEYYEKALAIRERVLGKEHPYTAITYSNLGIVYKVRGDYLKALEYYGKALVARQRVLGTEYQDTNSIASAYIKQGDYGKALELYEKGLNVFTTRLQKKNSSSEVLTDDYNRQMSVIQNQINDFFEQDSKEYYRFDAFHEFLQNNYTDAMHRLISNELRYLFRISENDSIIPVHSNPVLQLLLYHIWMFDTQRLKEQRIVAVSNEKALQEDSDIPEHPEQYDNDTSQENQKQDLNAPSPSALEEATLIVVRSFQKWIEKKLNEEGRNYRIIQQAYRQTSGEQYGYDVGLELKIGEATYKLGFECKDYTSNKKEGGRNSNINIRAYAINLLKYFINSNTQTNNRWVLVNPFGDLQNDYPNKLFETWNQRHSYLHIFAITETQVYPTCEDFFSVNESAYQMVYPEGHISPEKKDKKDKVFSFIYNTYIGRDYVSIDIRKKLKRYSFPNKFICTQSSDLLSERTRDGKSAYQEILHFLTDLKSDTDSKSKRNGIYIIGKYGTGKTWLLYRVIVEIMKHPAKYPFVPVLMRLKEVPAEELCNNDASKQIIYSIAEKYVEGVLNQQDQLEDNSMQNLSPVFLLDGFDEVMSGLSATNNKIRILLSIRDILKSRYRNANPVFIITSRESDFHACQTNKEFIELFNQFYKITLEDCPVSEAKEKLYKFAKNTDVDQKSVAGFIENQNILELACRPVFYALLTQLLEGGKSSLEDVVDEFSLLNNAIDNEINRSIDELIQANRLGNIEDLRQSLQEALLNCAIDCTKNNGNEAPIIFSRRELIEIIPNGLVSVKNKSVESATPEKPWTFIANRHNECRVRFLHNIVREFLVAKKFYSLIVECVSSETNEQIFFDMLNSVQMSPASLRFFLIFVKKSTQEEEIKKELMHWLCRPDIKKEDSGLSTKLLELLLQPNCAFGGSEDEQLDLSGIHADNLCIWNCKLQYLNLKNAHLRNMQMTDTKLVDVDLRGADLSGLRLAPSKPITDICHYKKNGEWHLAVLYQNGQVLEYLFTNRFMQDSYSVKLLQQYEDATGLFRINDIQYIIISGRSIYRLEDKYKLENALYELSGGKSIQRIIPEEERNSIFVMNGKDYSVQVIDRKSMISYNLGVTAPGLYYMTKDGELVTVDGDAIKLISQNGTTKNLCKWKNDYECFTIHQQRSGENNIYIKSDDHLIQITFDEQFDNGQSQIEYRIEGTCGMMREIRAIKADVLVGIGESDLYIMTVNTNAVMAEKVNTTVEASHILLENQDGTERIKNQEAYELMTGSLISFDETE